MTIGGLLMKKFLVAGIAAAALLSTPARAADLPTKGYTPAPAVWNWAGFYVGGDIGGAWARDDVSPTGADGGTFPRTNKVKESILFGGGTLGYNIQNGSSVAGLEVDLGDMSLNKSRADVLGGTEVDFIHSGFYGDVTGRLGLTFANILVYGKGGYAYLDGHGHTTTGLAGFTVAQGGNFNGWTLGGGVEFKISPAWSLKAEYMHFDFTSKNAAIINGGGTVFPYRNDLAINTVKVGINYLFGH
jgi:outer membrane immunogenic protein